MWPNPQFPVDLVTFTEEILNGKFNFLGSELLSRAVNFYRELLNLAELGQSNDPYKSLPPAEIDSWEQHVRNVISILEALYLNPSNAGLDKNELYNLNSGIPLRKVVEDLVNIWGNQKVQEEQFAEKRIFSQNILFHQPV